MPGEDRQEAAPLRDRVVDALSHPLRVRLLKCLEDHAATASALKEELGGDLSRSAIGYHLQVLVDAGCVEALEAAPGKDAEERIYRPRSGVFLEASFRAHSGVIETRASAIQNWRDIQVDDLGLDQLSDLLQSARCQIALIEEQSRDRVRMTGHDRMPVTVGIVAFATEPTPQDEGSS